CRYVPKIKKGPGSWREPVDDAPQILQVARLAALEHRRGGAAERSARFDVETPSARGGLEGSQLPADGDIGSQQNEKADRREPGDEGSQPRARVPRGVHEQRRRQAGEEPV